MDQLFPLYALISRVKSCVVARGSLQLYPPSDEIAHIYMTLMRQSMSHLSLWGLPFWCHHDPILGFHISWPPQRSDWNDTLRWMWWLDYLMLARSSRRCCMKDFSDFMMWLACAKQPTNDSSSYLVHECLFDHFFTRSCNSSSFSTWRWISHASKSSSKPRNVSLGVGLSNLPLLSLAVQGFSTLKSPPQRAVLSLMHLPKEIVNHELHSISPGNLFYNVG